MSIKQFSAEVTTRYLYGIMLKVRVNDLGPDAAVQDINTVNRVLSEVNVMDEGIRTRLRAMPGYVKTTDPDADCA